MRNSMSYVNQQEFLFDDTILYNLTLGDSSYTMQQVERVTKAIGAHDFINALPDGYNTQVGDSGICLSGGQRQMLSIARALLRNTSLIILDEAHEGTQTTLGKNVINGLSNNRDPYFLYLSGTPFNILSLKSLQIYSTLLLGLSQIS